MVQKSDPYENVITERINGILKYDIDKFEYKKDFDQTNRRCINKLTPHLSNHYLA